MDMGYNEFIIIFVILYFLIWYYKFKSWDFEGIKYDPLMDSSFPNSSFPIGGNKWTKNSILKRIYKESDSHSLKFDNFDYPFEVKQRYLSVFKPLLMKKAEVHIPPESLIESLVMFAPMKGGKTSTLMSWLSQDWYDRAIINEQKAGDFISKYLNVRKDIILCYFDKRAHAWDILSEEIPIIEFYIVNSLNSATKDESFFTSDAKERYKQIAMLTLEFETSNEKWEIFIGELESMFKEIGESDDRTAQSVAATMVQVIEPLKLTAFQIKNGKKTFTIKDFFNRKNQARLYMLNVDKYAVSLKPLFTAFTACVAMIHASLKETKTDLTYYLLDEYLSLEMTYEARKILHTKTRSKGAAVVSAMQFLPEEKKIRDLLTSSAFAYMFFSVKNESTREFLDSQIGKREYLVRKKVDNQYREETKKEEIIDWDKVDKFSKHFQHVSYIPEDGSLYVGKSDLVVFPTKEELKKKGLKPREAFVLDPLVENFYLEQNKEYRKKKIVNKNVESAIKRAIS